MRRLSALALLCLATALLATDGTARAGPGEVGNPNDPAWSFEWGQRLTRASDLWQLTTGNPSIVIAVVDTGLAPIPDLTDVVSGWDIVGNTNSTPITSATELGCRA